MQLLIGFMQKPFGIANEKKKNRLLGGYSSASP